MMDDQISHRDSSMLIEDKVNEIEKNEKIFMNNQTKCVKQG